VSNFNQHRKNAYLTADRLWESVRDVVELKTAMRQAGDDAFATFLGDIRRGPARIGGEMSTESLNAGAAEQSRITRMYDFLASKVVSEPLDSSWNFAPMVVAQNDLRMILNEQAAKRLAKANNCGVAWVVAKDKIGGKTHHALREDVGNHLRGKNDMLTGKVPGRFPLVHGLPVVVQDNVCLDFAIANGTTGTLIGWVPDAREPEHSTLEEHDLQYMPKALLIKLDQFQNFVKMDGLEAGVIPLFPTVVNFKTKIKRVEVPVTRQGFMVGVNIATTVHKIQGRTVNKAIVDLTEKMDYNKMVVILSRVKSANGLRIMRPFDRNVLLLAPSNELQAMEAELRRQHEATITKRQTLWEYCVQH